MKRAIERAAKKISDKIKTDDDFHREYSMICKGVTRDELMPAFLNMRLAINPDQVFRVLRLSCPAMVVKS